MPYFKVTINYRQFNNGWGETFYRQANSAREAAAITVPNLNKFLLGRGYGTYIRSVKAIEDGATRNSYTFVENLFNSTTFANGPSPDVCSTTALVNLAGSSAGNRHWWPRGLRDDLVKRNNDGSPITAEINGIVLRWQAAILANNFRIKRLPTGGAMGTEQEVTSLVPRTGNSNWTVINTTVTGAARGFYLSFLHVPKTLCGFPRVARIVEVAGSNPVIKYRLRNPDNSLPASIVGGGLTVRLFNDFDYPAITNATFVDWTKRDTGRPTGLQRGRRSAGCRLV